MDASVQTICCTAQHMKDVKSSDENIFKSTCFHLFNLVVKISARFYSGTHQQKHEDVKYMYIICIHGQEKPMMLCGNRYKLWG